jgi:hypothetical protein
MATQIMEKRFEIFITENPNTKIEIIPIVEMGTLINFTLKAVFNDGENEFHKFGEIESLDLLYSYLKNIDYHGDISLHFA